MSSSAMANEIYDPPVNYTDLGLRVQEQIRRKFLPLCTEDEKQQVLTTLMPMVYFAPSTVSSPSQHVLVVAKIPDQCPQLLRWALTCFIYGLDKIEAARKNGEYVKANRDQLARFQLEKGPCIPLPKPRPDSRKTVQKRRNSQAQPGDTADVDDGQRRVKAKTPLTQSKILNGDANKSGLNRREANLMQREIDLEIDLERSEIERACRRSSVDSREAALNSGETNRMQREIDLEKSEIDLTCRISAVDSREAALNCREASVMQRETDLESTLSTRQTASDSRSADLEHSDTAMKYLLQALDTQETELNNREAALGTRGSELNNREVILDTRNTELNNREAAMDTRTTELNNREAALDTRASELHNCEIVLETRNTELNHREAALESYEIGQDDGEARLQGLEMNFDNLKAGLDKQEARLGRRKSDIDDRMATWPIGASQPDSAHKEESEEDSALPQDQAVPHFDDAYIEEYEKCNNRAILDIMLLRSLGDAGRTVQDEKFRDALMEEFKERTESLADATSSARRIFECLFRSQDASARLLCR